ncbi:hypothetical protein PAXINDRAFT_14951 [Paxillus involutus ATCC 200175]|uniref:Uncharacterized protein n=1 Tax=Paxillus involutus ATCC 200175 TaxID=664439 RepID=A0A0C9TNW2_PAXIN|nr:hypothetical protein PAXINDRAFT_14951 [Paxillus involutus ATCC 200175]
MDLIADYMLDVFQECLNPDPSIAATVPLPCIPLEATLQADMFTEMLVTAYKNPTTIDINSKRLADALSPKDYGTKQKQEDELLRRFPTSPLPYIMKPSACRQRWGHLGMVSVRPSVPRHPRASSRSNWRNTEAHFKDTDLEGCLNFSPGWFQQGRSSPDWLPKVSTTLKVHNADQGGRKWLDNMLIPLSMLSAALAIMHLDLYVAGRESIIKLYKEQGPQDPEMAALLECWPSVFLASSVIVNHETPFHRDHNSRVQWFDLLASIGCYPGSVFDMPTLGTACYYPPGSVIGISGNLVHHGVA